MDDLNMEVTNAKLDGFMTSYALKSLIKSHPNKSIKDIHNRFNH